MTSAQDVAVIVTKAKWFVTYISVQVGRASVPAKPAPHLAC